MRVSEAQEAQKPVKIVGLPKKPKKTVEIRGFSIDFARPQAALF
jgi:hypothetical protein